MISNMIDLPHKPFLFSVILIDNILFVHSEIREQV